MIRRRLADLTKRAVGFAVLALLVWREVEAFEAFQARSSDAGFWAFLIDRGPSYLFMALGVVAIVALAMWLESKPTTDADHTEFHEKEAR